MKKLKNKQGFTLIEVVVVMAIIAVLAVLVVGAITVARNTAKETTHRSNAKALQAGFEAYFAKNKAYPGTSTDATITFTAAKDAAIANVSLADADECATKKIGTISTDGGGYVTYSSAGYTIQSADAACTAVLDDAITQ